MILKNNKFKNICSRELYKTTTFDKIGNEKLYSFAIIDCIWIICFRRFGKLKIDLRELNSWKSSHNYLYSFAARETS